MVLQHLRFLVPPSPNIYASYLPSLGGGGCVDDGDGGGDHGDGGDGDGDISD